MKLMLINSPNEVEENQKNANYSLFPHIGIVQLATRVKKEFGNKIIIKIIDGGISTSEKIKTEIKAFNPDLTGISVLTPTYGEGLKLAEFASVCGSKVVLGDDHAIFFPNEILKNRPYIDFIITNDVGEQPFIELIQALYYEKKLDTVCSLAFKKDNKVFVNARKKYFLLHQNTIPDLALIEDKLDIYSNKYYEAHGHLHGKKIRSVTINNARGCENGRVRCSYCSIADLAVNTGDPKKHWQLIEEYHNDFSINLFFEVYDSFTASPRYTDALLSTMPNHIKIKIENGDIELMIYARALGLLKKDNVKKFRKIGVKRVNIGLDSGDKKMLEAQRKNKTTDETNLNALKLLNQENMSVHGSFMLGATGETVESVNNTMNHIYHCIDSVKFSSIEVSRLFPLPNSPIWDIMINYERPQFYKSKQEIINTLNALKISVCENAWKNLSKKYSARDLFTSGELMPDWYEHFTHVDETFVLDKIAELDNYILRSGIQTGNNIG